MQGEGGEDRQFQRRVGNCQTGQRVNKRDGFAQSQRQGQPYFTTGKIEECARHCVRIGEVTWRISQGWTSLHRGQNAGHARLARPADGQ